MKQQSREISATSLPKIGMACGRWRRSSAEEGATAAGPVLCLRPQHCLIASPAHHPPLPTSSDLGSARSGELLARGDLRTRSGCSGRPRQACVVSSSGQRPTAELGMSGLKQKRSSSSLVEAARSKPIQCVGGERECNRGGRGIDG